MFVFKKSKNCMRRPRPVASGVADAVVEQAKKDEQKPQAAKAKSQAKKAQQAKEEVQLEDNEIKSE